MGKILLGILKLGIVFLGNIKLKFIEVHHKQHKNCDIKMDYNETATVQSTKNANL